MHFLSLKKKKNIHFIFTVQFCAENSLKAAWLSPLEII